MALSFEQRQRVEPLMQEIQDDIEEWAFRVVEQQAEIERLREALIRLRDCDWVISLPDRMDAVRDIAKAALEGRDE